MPPDPRTPANPAEWMRRARSNLVRAKRDRGLAEVLYEDLCFDAQQAAEKAIKAVLVRRAVPFPKTHAVTQLLTLAQRSGVEVPDEIRSAGRLTRYAVITRYPGLAEEVTEEDYLQAVDLAERVLQWAAILIAG
jgi:HEPN domain-containing protein